MNIDNEKLKNTYSVERVPYHYSTTLYLRISAEQVVYWLQNCDDVELLKYLSYIAKKTARELEWPDVSE